MSLAGVIAAQRQQYGIPQAVSCRALGVSQAWFYKWRGGDRSVRRSQREALTATIVYLFGKHRGTYGSPRITADLQELGWRVSVNTVAGLMREQGLVARAVKKRRALTKRDRNARKAPDLLRRDFAPPPQVNQRWVSDLTEVPTAEGVLYLAAILDLNSRRCVGYAMSTHHDADLSVAALQVAIAIRGGDVTGVVFHTDQGGEFTAHAIATICRRAGITQSMGRTGSALDNAVAESFNSTLEFELLASTRFTTRTQARRAVVAWLEDYNTTRRHSVAAMMAPVAFEAAARRGDPKATSRTYRRRRSHRPTPTTTAPSRPTAEAATPPTLSQPLRATHQPRAAYGPVPPASRAATAVAAATVLRTALDPGASTGPGRPRPRAGPDQPAPPAREAAHEP